MLLDKGYSIIETGLERDYTLEELKALIGDVDGVIADSSPGAKRRWPPRRS